VTDSGVGITRFMFSQTSASPGGLGIEIPENTSARSLPQTMAARYTSPGFSRGYTVGCQTITGCFGHDGW